jgi:polysaccharide export outer membrane protein
MIRRTIASITCLLSIALVPIAIAQQPQSTGRQILRAGNQISIEYTLTPDFNETVTIQPDGYITLKVGDDVQIAGKTIEEAKALIEQSAKARLTDPIVVINLIDYQKPYYVVAGEALAPAKYELRENLTVLQAVMIAGGIKQTGKEKQVILIRAIGTDHQAVHLLDLKKVQTSAIFSHDMALNPGDIIFIPRNKITRAQQIMSLVTGPAAYANTAATAVYTVR